MSCSTDLYNGTYSQESILHCQCRSKTSCMALVHIPDREAPGLGLEEVCSSRGALGWRHAQPPKDRWSPGYHSDGALIREAGGSSLPLVRSGLGAPGVTEGGGVTRACLPLLPLGHCAPAPPERRRQRGASPALLQPLRSPQPTWPRSSSSSRQKGVARREGGGRARDTARLPLPLPPDEFIDTAACCHCAEPAAPLAAAAVALGMARAAGSARGPGAI